jgi:NCS1 family nucleobase:cation symporter-1
VLCLIWPTANQKIIKQVGLGWEERCGDTVVAEDRTEIVEEGERVSARSELSDEVPVATEEYGVQKKY